MLQIDQTKPETRYVEKIFTVSLFYILVLLFIFITTCFFAIKINQSNKLADKTRNKVEESSSHLAWSSKQNSTDIVCYIELRCIFSMVLNQVHPSKRPNFSSEASIIAIKYLKEKRLKNHAKLLVNKTIVLLKYRFFELKKILEKNQAKSESIAKLSQNKDSLSFIKGLVLGEKDKKNNYYLAFQRAGLVHILVASGFNISLLAGLTSKFLNFLSKKLRICLSLAVCWLYIWFLGGEPPLFRAGLMLSFYYLLGNLGWTISSRRIVFYSGVILLLINLNNFVNLSFWFSFLATLGLILFSNRFLLFINSSNLSFIEFFKAEFFTSLSAQLLILPLVITVFSEFNWLGFLTNTLFLFPIAWFTQVGFILFFSLLLLKNSFFIAFIYPISLMYRNIVLFFIYLIQWFKQLFFLQTYILPEETIIYLFIWLLVFLFITGLLRRKHNRKMLFFYENV